MLLDDIIQTGVDSSQSLSILLRKCLLLAHELKNKQLKSWANQELSGYSAASTLPEYRIIQAGAKGDFFGRLAVMRNRAIPSMSLEEKHRLFGQKVYLRQAVSAYENAMQGQGDAITFAWPADMIAYYQERFVDGYVLVSAWQSVPKSSLVELIDTIRNRTLNMALEIKDDLRAAATNLRDMSPSQTEKIQRRFINNIYGGTNYFATDQAQITAKTTVQTTISVGDRKELDMALRKSGLGESELRELTAAVEADGNRNMGSKVLAWIRSTAPKVVAAGVKVGSTIGEQLLTQWLRQYFGLNG